MDAPPPDPAARDAPDVSVVVVSYNVRAFLEQALRSVNRAGRGLRVEVFVVDNASADGSPDVVRTRFPHVRLIENTENAGFSRANNQALRLARGRHVLILNPDTILEEGTLHALTGFLDARPEAGAVGPAILNPDGTFAPESRRAFPTPEVALYRITGLSRLFPRHARFGRYNLTYLPRDQVCEVNALSGSCMLVRRAAFFEGRGEGREPWAVGRGQEQRADPSAAASGDAPDGAGSASLPLSPHAPTPPRFFDEDFFMYGEDLDLCFRLQAAGWKIFYTPDTRIIHYKGESTKKGELRYVRLFYGAMLLFAEKHLAGARAGGRTPGGGLLTAGIRAAIVGRAAVGLLRRAAAAAAPALRDALVAFFALALAGSLYTGRAPGALGARFYWTAGVAFALSTVIGVALAGGYGPRGRTRLRPAFAGAAFALLAVSALSFYVKAMAFSRGAVLAGFVLALAGLAAARGLARRRRGPRRAIFVGTPAEAARLAGRLKLHPRAPFVLVGLVGDGARGRRGAGVPHLGPSGALRDLVRFEHVSAVIFGTEALPASKAFALMQALADLPVDFKMLAPDGAHVIGKASVDALGLADAERVL